MNTYLADASILQPSSQPAGLTVISWIKGRLAARRARLAERQTLAFLASLDRHTLDDIGIDPATFCKTMPPLVRLNP